MKKSMKKLSISRETLLDLTTPSLQRAAAAAQAFQMLETRNEPSWCPCTDTCM